MCILRELYVDNKTELKSKNGENCEQSAFQSLNNFRKTREGESFSRLKTITIANIEISRVVLNEPPHGKTNNLHRRKQRRRSASRLPRS